MAQMIITQMLEYCKEKGITAKTLLAKNEELSEKTVGNFLAGKVDDCRASTLASIARSIGMQIIATSDGETPLDVARHEIEIRERDEHIFNLEQQLRQMQEAEKEQAVKLEKDQIELKWHRRCLKACIILLAALLLISIGVVLIDLLNHDIGWIRSAAHQLGINQTSVRL